jgi:hypothetical protein
MIVVRSSKRGLDRVRMAVMDEHTRPHYEPDSYSASARCTIPTDRVDTMALASSGNLARGW